MPLFAQLTRPCRGYATLLLIGLFQLGVASEVEPKLLPLKAQLSGRLSIIAPAAATSTVDSVAHLRRIVVSAAGPENWHVAWKLPVEAALQAGDVVQITAQVRCVKSPGRATLLLIEDTPPSVVTLGLVQNTTLAQTWTPMTMLITMPREIKSGISVLSLNVGDQAQTIELGRITMVRSKAKATVTEQQQIVQAHGKTLDILPKQAQLACRLRLQPPAQATLALAPPNDPSGPYVRLRTTTLADAAWKAAGVWNIVPSLRSGTRVTLTLRVRCISGGPGNLVVDWKERNSATGWLAGVKSSDVGKDWSRLSTSVVLDRQIPEDVTELVVAFGGRQQTIDISELTMEAEVP